MANKYKNAPKKSKLFRPNSLWIPKSMNTSLLDLHVCVKVVLSREAAHWVQNHKMLFQLMLRKSKPLECAALGVSGTEKLT